MRQSVKTTTGQFKKPLLCAKCGARLPAEVMQVEGKTVIAVFCKHCKTVTIAEIEG